MPYLRGHRNGGGRGRRRFSNQRNTAVQQPPEISGLLALSDNRRSTGGGILVFLQQGDVIQRKLRGTKDMGNAVERA